jgi:hypothetical protein
MIIRRKVFEKYEKYNFSIPYRTGDKVIVKSQEKVKEGTELIKRSGSHIKYSFFIPEQIDIGIKEISKCLNCIDGELVDKGDVLAQRVVAGGLSVKKLISPAQGVIDLSRINKGFLDVLGEESDVVVKSSFNGIIESVSPIDGVNICSSAYALDILAISDQEFSKENKIVGELVVLGEALDLKLTADESNYEDKIVFVGKYLHADLLHDLFEKGASFVLTDSMDYEDFRRQGLPVGVIGGFGEIYSSKEILNLVSKMVGKFVVVDYKESQMFFITDTQVGRVKEELFVKTLVGSSVISRSLSNYGMLGRIIDIEDNLYATVQWEAGQKSMMNIGNLEFVSL